MSKQKLDEAVFSKMLTALSNSFTEERKKSEPYKEMFKAGSSLTGLLRDLEHKMTMHILDAGIVYEERHGKKFNRDQRNILMALPLLAKIAEQDANRNEGLGCCVDKAYFLLSEQLIALESPSPPKEQDNE